MLLLLSFATSITCAQTLYVREKTGIQTDYSLTSIQKLTFTPGKLQVIKTVGNSDEYQLEALRHLSFSEIIIWIDDPPMDDSKASFIIYPNPARESIKIISNGNETLCGIIELLNINGQVVKSQATSGGREMEVDVRDIGNGIYLCRFSDGNKVETSKFIKQ
jgi:hypothetical protein